MGHLRANGHPSSGPWRQCYGTACAGSCLETHGTICHGTRVAVELLLHVIACLAAGLGMRGTARGFAVEPHTVLQWLVEAAAPLQALTASWLRAGQIPQLQLDEL